MSEMIAAISPEINSMKQSPALYNFIGDFNARRRHMVFDQYENNSCKPKMLVRNLHDIVLDWHDAFPNDEHRFQLQMCNDLKEWRTIYCGKRTHFKVDSLAPCTCYDFRIKIEHEDEWIHFKAATADDGPHSLVMHMSRAVKLGKASLIRKMAHIRPHLLEAENKENKTPLVQAVEVGDPQIIQLLITLGANVNTPLFHNKRTPLMVAVYKNRLQIATILIDKGSNIYAKDINGLNVLHYAVDSNNIENVRYVLKTDIDVNSKDSHGLTSLLRAAILSTSNDIIDVLLKSGADRNAKDRNGMNFEKHLLLNNSNRDNYSNIIKLRKSLGI